MIADAVNGVLLVLQCHGVILLFAVLYNFLCLSHDAPVKAHMC